MSKFLSRDDILSAVIKTTEVDVPEWDGKVKVRELTSHEATELGFGMVSDEGKIDRSQVPDMMAKAVALAAIDENGERLFSEDDVELLRQKSFGPIQRIANAVLNMSGMSKAKAKEGSDEAEGGDNSKNP